MNYMPMRLCANGKTNNSKRFEHAAFNDEYCNEHVQSTSDTSS